MEVFPRQEKKNTKEGIGGLAKVNFNKLMQLMKAIRIYYAQVIRPALSLQSLLIMLPAGLVARQRYVAECSSGL